MAILADRHRIGTSGLHGDSLELHSLSLQSVGDKSTDSIASAIGNEFRTAFKKLLLSGRVVENFASFRRQGLVI